MKQLKLMAMALAVILGLTPMANAAQPLATDTGGEYTIHEAYVYPVTPDDPQWFATDSHLDRVNYCQIPDDILKAMDTQALVATIADYPLLIDVLAFDTADLACSTITSGFNAFQELETRPDAKAALDEFIATDASLENDFVKRAAMQVVALAMNLPDDGTSIRAYNTAANYSDAYKIYPELAKNISVATERATPTPPRTPSGTYLSTSTRAGENYPDAIYDQTQETMTAADIADMNNKIANVYKVKQLSPHNDKYNCHSYAWYSQSANKWWINASGVKLYLADPRVVEIKTTAIPGDRVLYTNIFGTIKHSGIIASNANGNPVVHSKWGLWGVYEHGINNHPSEYGGATNIYRIK